MIRNQQDTIAAIATASGEGGIAIVRISGPGAEEILKGAFRPAGPGPMEDHALRYGRLISASGEVLDECMAVLMKAPRTYTRQDVGEIHCHGGRAAARTALARVLELGARPAGSGEFTLRAFLNGRIDLSQAEAVMGLIGASSQAAARMSVRQIEGGVTRFVHSAREQLTGLLSEIEAANDFPEEIDSEVTAGQVAARCRALSREIAGRCDERGARMVRNGVRVALCGRPNVGKSSLLNALLGVNRAIVTDVPGTTRDVLTERLTLSGLLLEVSDTAGQRDTQDAIERMGVERARQEEERADVVLLLLDGSAPLTAEDEALLSRVDGRTLLVRSKCDLAQAPWADERAIPVSCRTRQGLDALSQALVRRAGAGELDEDMLVVERHLGCARRAREAIDRAAGAIESGLPLDAAAVDLWEARFALGEITGEDASEEVISDIFSRFCVGK